MTIHCHGLPGRRPAASRTTLPDMLILCSEEDVTLTVVLLGYHLLLFVRMLVLYLQLYCYCSVVYFFLCLCASYVRPKWLICNLATQCSSLAGQVSRNGGNVTANSPGVLYSCDASIYLSTTASVVTYKLYSI